MSNTTMGISSNDNWKFFKEIDFTDDTAKQFHVDTRDFRVMPAYRESEAAPSLTKLRKYPTRFFHTAEEVSEMLNRFYEQSGGDKEWRYLALPGIGDWSIKYLRIYRTPHGLLVCDNNDRALRKDVLAQDVDTEILNQ
jgi:hypothetical protein